LPIDRRVALVHVQIKLLHAILVGFHQRRHLPQVQRFFGKQPHNAPARHRTISDAGLIGGGMVRAPGEVSLAHNGLLRSDEGGYVTLSRKSDVRPPNA
jgi:predicted ATPase with chaperone activity